MHVSKEHTTNPNAFKTFYKNLQNNTPKIIQQTYTWHHLVLSWKQLLTSLVHALSCPNLAHYLRLYVLWKKNIKLLHRLNKSIAGFLASYVSALWRIYSLKKIGWAFFDTFPEFNWKSKILNFILGFVYNIWVFRI